MISVVLSVVFISMLLLTSLSFAQVPTNWNQYDTLNRCGITFSYPNNWMVSEEISRNRFDTSDSSVISVSSPNQYPKFSIMGCHALELKEKSKYTNNTDLLLQLDVNDAVLESLELGGNLRGAGAETIELAHTIPKIISNSTINATVFTLKINDIGFEIYTVLHNGIAYSFYYFDMANNYDSLESKRIRDGILQSINFVN